MHLVTFVKYFRIRAGRHPAVAVYARFLHCSKAAPGRNAAVPGWCEAGKA